MINLCRHRVAAMAALAAISVALPPEHRIGPGEPNTGEGRLVPPPPNRQPPLRDDTWTARRKAKARARARL